MSPLVFWSWRYGGHGRAAAKHKVRNVCSGAVSATGERAYSRSKLDFAARGARGPSEHRVKELAFAVDHLTPELRDLSMGSVIGVPIR